MKAANKSTIRLQNTKTIKSVSQPKNYKDSPSTEAPVDCILTLQRTIGNQAVGRLLNSSVIQAKSKISQPGDKYEQEAERVAEQVMQMPAPQLQRQPTKEDEEEKIQTKSISEQITPQVQLQPVKTEEEEEKNLMQPKLAENSTSSLQRQAEEEEKEEPPLMPKEVPGKTPEVTPGVESQINALKGSGKPLPESLRSFFEPRFGADFSQVRVHTGEPAAATANALNAQAYTIGRNVVFGAGKFAPEANSGKRLLAHELAHVIAQTPSDITSDQPFLYRFKDPYHEEMLRIGLKGTEEEKEWREVYFGSWLRDYSQVLQADSNAAFKKVAIFVLNRIAKEKFDMGVDEKRLGYYRAEEHMDNPDVSPPATALPIRTSVVYIRQELSLAAQLGRTTEGRIHFGQALHVLEDFFSHSNFVLGAEALCMKPGSRIQPLTSGVFQHKDTIVSILEMMVNFVRGKINQSQFSLTPAEKAKQWLGKVLPLPAENRLPDIYYQDPRQHLENRPWIEALDILEPALAKAREEAKSAAKVPTHTELHQDDPSRPLYPIAKALSENLTHEVAIQMDIVWNDPTDKQQLDKLFRLIDDRMQSPDRTISWWKPILKSSGVYCR